MSVSLTSFTTKPSKSCDDLETHGISYSIPPTTPFPSTYPFTTAGSAASTPSSSCHRLASGSPPSSPPSFSTGSATSAVSDTGEDNFPPTPNSKQSGFAYGTHNAPSRVVSPTPGPSHSFENNSERSNTSPFLIRSTSFEDRHLLFRLAGRSINDLDSFEPTSQMVSDAYRRITEELSMDTFRCLLYYLEVVHERKRMTYFTSCWEVTEIKRWEALVISMREESKADFITTKQESQYLLDIFAERLSLPRSTATDGPYLNAACDNAKLSLSRTSAELSILKARADVLEDRMADDWYVLSLSQVLFSPVAYTSPEITMDL
ncbi:hypothetical protein CY34DRAFT_16000 [Suillus luteus UH-Slu-Lm8-n1]|uniref:Unplaced genomic scaffold CY34scaffold_351, whole genome shotgun sequence n=1 Tax=Suillus luteus UH-Slu-Lm8-n1 TaxID=930992 RepID=A0A0C9ZHZ8_9AGAM|nr:hypothetical protein CY34DRAFT_16000 [Suillus luteus UH-Slu-Lm8-n1]